MGLSFSQVIPEASYDSQYCVLAFPSRLKADEMMLIDGVMGLKDSITESIQRGWPRGLQQLEENSNTVTVFKLRGRPFARGGIFTSAGQRIELGRLMCAILEDALRRGWRLCAMVNMHRRSKTESMVFARGRRDDIRPKIAALVLSSSDQISMVGLPQHLHDTLVRLVEKNWPQGISSIEKHDPDGFAVVTKRWPFRYTWISQNIYNIRKLMLDIIHEIYMAGFEFYGAGHPQIAIEEVSTLFFAESEQPDYAPRMFLLAPHIHDYLITVNAPEECVSVLRKCVMENWPQQIHNERTIEGLHAIKMNGYPFRTYGEEVVYAIRVLIRTFEELRRLGWRLEATFDMSKNINDTSTFLMVQSPPAYVNFVAVKLSGSDALILVNASRDVVEAVRAELNAALPGRISEKEVGGCPRFDLNRPLHQMQAVISLVINRIESLGLKLVSSADLSAKYGQTKNSQWPEDYHTLFFEKRIET